DEDFVRLGVLVDARRFAQVLDVVAALALADVAELQEELAVSRELQDLTVLRAGARQPHVVLVIDEHAVHAVGPPAARWIGARAAGSWPFVTLSGSAPRLDDVAGEVELDDVRRADAAFGARRSLFPFELVRAQR